MSYLDCCGLRSGWFLHGAASRRERTLLQSPPQQHGVTHEAKRTNATLTMFLDYESQLDVDSMSADDHASDMEALGQAVSAA